MSPTTRTSGATSEPLLARARRLVEQRDVQTLCSLAPELELAPARDRAELACLVGSALIESLCGARALTLCEQALPHSRSDDEQLQLRLVRARAYQELSEIEHGLEEIGRARPLLARTAGPYTQVALLAVEAALLSSRGDQEQSGRLGLQMLELCGAPEYAEWAVEACALLALTSLRRGALDEADRWANQARERADERMGLRQADALRTLGIVRANRSELLPAIMSLQQAIRIYRQQQSPRGLFKGYMSLGLSYLAMGELDHAEFFFNKCRALAEGGEDLVPRSLVYARMGQMHSVRGEPAQALEFYLRDQQLNAQLNNPLSRGYPELGAGEALLELARLPEAAERLKLALRLFTEVSDPVRQARAHLALARVEAELSLSEDRPPARLRAALERLKQARQLLEPLGRVELMSQCALVEALVLLARKRIDEGLERYRSGIEVLERQEDVAAATHATYRMGAMLAHVGARAMAVEMYLEALRRAEMHQFHGLRRTLLERLGTLDENALVDRSLGVGGPSSRDLMRQKVKPEDLRGASPALQSVRRLIEQVAPTDVPVLILGESGTGKELVARAVHFSSQVARGPLVVLNCGAIPRDLVESELFGHVRGAFTGAVRSHVGCLERADRGTIFLDEIGDLPLDAQVKLLRFLSTGEVLRIGESKALHVDVRVIAATHRDLRRQVAEGRFREDLFYRLAVFEIHTAPLRALREDIPLLVSQFLAREPLAHARGIRRLSAAALEALERYPWPGNVRELENAIRRACVVCQDPVVQLEHLPETVIRSSVLPEEVVSPGLRDAGLARIRQVLSECGGNQVRAARILGIHRNTLRRRLDEAGKPGKAEPPGAPLIGGKSTS